MAPADGGLSLTKVLKAIGEKWKEDPSRASLVLSDLGADGFYASVVRYKKAYGEEKEVVAGAKASSLQSAVTMVMLKLKEKGIDLGVLA